MINIGISQLSLKFSVHTKQVRKILFWNCLKIIPKIKVRISAWLAKCFIKIMQRGASRSSQDPEERYFALALAGCGAAKTFSIRFRVLGSALGQRSETMTFSPPRRA